MTEATEKKARANVRNAQAEFEQAQKRAQQERAQVRAVRRERFAQAQKDGLTVRDIADETGLGFGRVAEILRGD